MHSRAQVSAEFFIFIGVAFMIAIAFSMSSLDQLNDFRLQQEHNAVKDIALNIQKELLTAAIVEDGYVRIFSLPDKLDNINYSLITRNSTITVQSKNSLFTVRIPKSTGNVSKGTITINKTGGVIYINSKPLSFSNSNTCQNAQNNGLCAGLDIAYGSGYQAACCSEHGLCC